MEARVSKVKNVTGNGTWESNHGLLYSFIYEMEDGSIFKANHKTQNPFELGQDAEYTITKQNAQYGDQGKIKKYNPDFAGNSFSNSTTPQKSEVNQDDRQIMIVRQTVLKAFADAKHFPFGDDCFWEMNKAVKWVMSGMASYDDYSSVKEHKDNIDTDNLNDLSF